MSEHEEFVQLCALYIAGELLDDQAKKLDQHLAACGDCRLVLVEFQEVASMGLSALAPDFAALPVNGDRSWVTERTKHRLLARIEQAVRAQAPQVAASRQIASDRKRGWLQSLRDVRAFLPYAAALFLTISIALYSYHLGLKQITNAPQTRAEYPLTRNESTQQKPEQPSKDREFLTQQLQQSARAISALRAEVQLHIAEITSLKEQEERLADAAQGAETKRTASESERDILAQKLEKSQTSLESAQKRLNAASDEHVAELAQIENLEKQLEETTVVFGSKDQTIQQQQELLAHDREIRDLMGARDLYVAEVTDVGRNDETQAPFARVFFTKGKSLIVYAYDLDKQPRLRSGSTFQAWGRRSPDFTNALSLGILSPDDSANKRWVLKFNDSVALAKIDAVFVTVEPKAGSQKPSGKPLLFAYLKVEPNHR